MKTRVRTFTNLFLSLSFCLGLASCNQEDFYEKEFLDNPFQSPKTEGPVGGGGQGGDDSGAGGDTQGGVDGGVEGGTTSGGTTSGSTTGSSTSGGTDGSATGGGVDGSTTGGSTGGGVDGSTSGGTDGSTTGGGVDGSTTSGGTDGSSTGGTTGGTGGYGDCNNGHGNDADGIDESNPTIGTETKCKKETFRQSSEQTKKLDIVWIIDNSGSMSDEQDALGTNFSAFIDEFISKSVDFKMAITTTDASTNQKKGKMVTGSDVKLTSARAQENGAQFKADFNTLVKVGTSGSGTERGLAASEGFMDKYGASFLRSDAYLAVVVVSDEEDQSSKTVEHYTDYLKSFKNEDGLVKVYTIADIHNTSGRTGGITTGASRYIEASNQTAGVIADIKSDFHQTLAEMGDSIINLLDSFALSSTPEDGSLRVYVNGVETMDYTFDSVSRSIKFNPNNLPPVGAEIVVTYIKK